jgi:hypothetical protein
MGVVRRPDPVPCPACAIGQWDFCENGQYTERGIKGRNGYGSQQWRADPRFVVPVPAALGDHGLLTEPTSAREIVRALIAEAAATALDREAQWIRLSES